MKWHKHPSQDGYYSEGNEWQVICVARANRKPKLGIGRPLRWRLERTDKPGFGDVFYFLDQAKAKASGADIQPLSMEKA